MGETDALDAGPDLELPCILTRARQQLLDAVDGLRTLQRFEVHMPVEDLVGEPIDPGAALADLAVRHRRQMAAERAAERAHHLLDGIQGYASDQQQIVGHCRCPPGTCRALS